MAVIVREKIKGSGDWWVFINHEGHRKAKHVGSKSAAKKVARIIEAKLAAKELQIDTVQTPTFGELSKEWIEITVPATCKESTFEDYQLLLRKHILPVFKSKPVDRITRRDIKQFLLGKLNKGYSPSTVNYIKAAVSGVLSVAVEGEIIPVNPARDIGRLYSKEAPNQELSPFSVGELDLLLGTIERHWKYYYPLMLALARTGMRIGEALALEWEDVDLRNRALMVKRTYSRGRLTTPKSGKSRRVDMSPQLTQTLADLKIKHKRDSLAKGRRTKSRLVFPNREGGHIDIDNFRSRVWNKAISKAGLPHHRIHDLRHTYATIRISKGDNIADVSKQLGHHSVKLTLDKYYHWLPGQSKSEVDELDGLQPSATYTQP